MSALRLVSIPTGEASSARKVARMHADATFSLHYPFTVAHRAIAVTVILTTDDGHWHVTLANFHPCSFKHIPLTLRDRAASPCLQQCSADLFPSIPSHPSYVFQLEPS